VAATDGKAAGVVVQILEPTFQFASTFEDVVVVVAREEEAVGAVVLSIGSSLLQHCCSIGGLTVGFVAAGLEAFEDHAQVLLHLVGDKEDAMQVVGHQLE